MGIENFIEIPIEKLHHAKWNYKDDEHEKAEVVMAALKGGIIKNGQLENIIVRELAKDKYEVVNGNHRLTAFQELGVDVAVCYNLGKITIAEAKRIAAETNETKFEPDHLKLAQLIKEIEEEFGKDDLLDTMPFDEKEIDSMMEIGDFNYDQFNQPKDTGTKPGQKESFKVITLKLPESVALQFREQMDRFKKIIYPDKDPKDINDIMPFEAMMQVIAMTGDHEVMGDAE